MKKFISVVLTLVLVTSALVLEPSQVSAASVNSFTDISQYLPEYENPLRYIVEEKEIHSIIKESESLENACNILIDKANENGGGDNITAVIIKLDTPAPEEKTEAKAE